jgi:hypothetical protein
LSTFKAVIMTDGIPNILRFLWCLYLQSLPIYQNFSPGFGVLWKTSEISSQFNLEQFRPSKLRELEDKSNPLLRRWPQASQPCCSRQRGKGLSSAYAVYPIRKAFVCHHTGLTTPGSLRGLREILPGMLLWQPRQQSRKNLEESAPVIWRRHFS